jgi:cysteine-rich repeat protein
VEGGDLTPTPTATTTLNFPCGNGLLDGGETCDPPGPGQPPNGNPCRTDCTYCGDALVNGAETCDDGNAVNNDDCRNDCMGALRKDPATIKFHSSEGETDRLKVRGGFTTDYDIDAGAMVVGVRLSNASGVIYSADLPVGAMGQVGNRYDFRDRDAKSDPLGGISRFWLKPGANGRYHVALTAYGDLSAATTPEMTIEVRFGGSSYVSGGTWDQKKYGWKLSLPWAN